MKRVAKLLLMLLLGLSITFAGGCIWTTEDDDDDCCYSDEYDYDPYIPVEEWYVVGPALTTLSVGNYCGCGSSCSSCGWFEEDFMWDTLFLSCYDYDMVDLQFNYTITNWGYRTTSVWVTLCDYLGCEDVFYGDVYPGETLWGRDPNPVLDSVLDAFDDCLYYYGDACYLEYEIDVYLGEECQCSPVTLDYYYEGLYVY